jgi:F0F1-type ATP synthase delta subunit
MSTEPLTPEQIERMQEELERKFGKELKMLESKVNKEMSLYGMVSKSTVQMRDKLMKRILDQKHREEQQEQYNE